MLLERLTGEDRIMLWGDQGWPQEIGALVFLDGTNLRDVSGRLRMDLIRAVVASRLHLVPRFRQVLYFPQPRQGPPLWVDDPGFDLDEHIRVLAIPSPGGEPELLTGVEQIRRERLDKSRPLWGMWFLTGLSDGRVALFLKLHHVIGDGIAGVATFGVFLDTTSDVAVTPPRAWTPAVAPTANELFDDNLHAHLRRWREIASIPAHPLQTSRTLRATLPALTEIFDVMEQRPPSSLDRVVGPDRRLALLRLSLADVMSVAHRHNAKVNDVLLTAVAGGLRELLRSRGEAAPGDSLRVYVPVTLRPKDSRSQARGNMVTQMMVPIPVAIADPVETLSKITLETAARKAKQRPSLDKLPQGRLFGKLIVKVLDRQRVNVTTANVQGPEIPLYFAGAQLEEVFPLLPLIAKESLGIGALSYAGQFNLMVVADRDAYPDLDVFVRGMGEELQALAVEPRTPELAFA